MVCPCILVTSRDILGHLLAVAEGIIGIIGMEFAWHEKGRCPANLCLLLRFVFLFVGVAQVKHEINNKTILQVGAELCQAQLLLNLKLVLGLY